MLALTYQPSIPTAQPKPQPASSEAAELRRQRGLAIAAMCRIVRKREDCHVPSQTGNGTHTVRGMNRGPQTCTCPDFEKRGEPCKHIFAVRFVFDRECEGNGRVTPDEAVALMPKVKAPRLT